MGSISQEIEEYTDIGYDANLDDLYYWQMVLQNGIDNILGILTVFIAVILTIITAFDIVYITLPVFQDVARSRNWDGSLSAKKIKPISTDARTAVENGQIGGSTPIGLYLRKRIKTYIVFACILLIVGTGSNYIAKIMAKIWYGIMSGIV